MKNYKQYFLADPHWGQESIIDFKDDQGNKIRPYNWESLLFENWKKVRPQDRVYILGDVVIRKEGFRILERLPGKKYLICGNHDIFGAKEYLKYFKDVRAYKMMPEYGIIFSHIPVHPDCLQGKFKFNVSGHIHHRKINDRRYLNICVEQTNYDLWSLEEILEKLGYES